MDWNGSNGKTSEPIVTQSREKLKENKEKKKEDVDRQKNKKIRSSGTKEQKTLKWRDRYEVRPDSIRKKP